MTSHFHDHSSHTNGDQLEHGHEHGGGFSGWVAGVLRPHSHDTADSVDNALESSAEGIRAVKLSLVALGVTALLQAGLVILTGRSRCWTTPFTTSPMP